MPQDDKFTYESIQDTQSIKDYINSILEGIERGKIVLSSNGEKLVLEPADMLKFAVKAKKKGETSKLSIKISWKNTKRDSEIEDNNIEITT